MKQTGFTLKRMLLLPLAVGAVLLLLLLVKGPREGTGMTEESREIAGAQSAQEHPEELKPKANDQELAGSIPVGEHQRLVTETVLADIPAESDATTRHRDQTETATAEPYVGAASFRCVVPDGGAMLTGGWPVPNGGHAFALISPKPMPDSDGHAVTVSAIFFELPDEQLASPEWEALLEPAKEGAHFRGTSLNSDGVAEFREAYVSKMTRIMSSPSVSMAAGDYASIQVTGSSDGVMLAVIAEQAGDGSGIDLNVSVAEHSGIELQKNDQEHK